MTTHPNRSWRRRLSSEAAALGPDMVTAYIRLLVGPTRAAVHLSALTGHAYSANLLCRWRRGGEPTPVIAQEAMRVVLLAELLGDDAPALARLLSPPAG